MTWQEFIHSDPNILSGKPVVKGTRVLVSNILGSLAAGESHQEILESYPNISEKDIRAALGFAGTYCLPG